MCQGSAPAPRSLHGQGHRDQPGHLPQPSLGITIVQGQGTGEAGTMIDLTSADISLWTSWHLMDTYVCRATRYSYPVHFSGQNCKSILKRRKLSCRGLVIAPSVQLISDLFGSKSIQTTSDKLEQILNGHKQAYLKHPHPY